jgi:hypothetical protein
MVVLVAIVGVAVVALGIWGIALWAQPTDAEVAAQLVDDFNEGWNTDDLLGIKAVFTEDAVYVDPDGNTIVGVDRIGWSFRTSGISEATRVGEATETDAGTFVFSEAFTHSSVGPFEGEFEVTLDGDLISRWEWLWMEEAG